MQSTSPVLDTSPGTSSSISSSYYERLETNQFEDQVLDIYKRFLLHFLSNQVVIFILEMI